MTVPTNIFDLSTTAASNSPAGTDAIGTNLDDFMRAHSAFIAQLETDSIHWCGMAGGTANAITLTPVNRAITAYKAGQVFQFKSGVSANSSAVTFAISGLTTIAGQVNGAACIGGEIQANQWYEIVLSDASTAQITQISSVGASIQSQTYTRFAAGGTADAVTGTLSPSISAYVTGLRISTTPVGANTVTGPTINLNALGNKTVKKKDSSGSKVALSTGDYNASGPFNFEYDGTDFILLDPLVSGSGGGAFRNKIINGNFSINQQAVSGTVSLSAGQYGHDCWKAGASGCTYTYSTVNNITTLTISAGTLIQITDGINFQSGTHVLSWSGSATARIDGSAYGASGISSVAVGGINQVIEFSTGTLSKVQYELGTSISSFEFRLYSTELSLAQRYYWVGLGSVYAHTASGSGIIYGSTIIFPTQMRTTPTLSNTGGTATNASAANFVDATPYGGTLIVASAGTGAFSIVNRTIVADARL